MSIIFINLHNKNAGPHSVSPHSKPAEMEGNLKLRESRYFLLAFTKTDRQQKTPFEEDPGHFVSVSSTFFTASILSILLKTCNLRTWDRLKSFNKPLCKAGSEAVKNLLSHKTPKQTQGPNSMDNKLFQTPAHTIIRRRANKYRNSIGKKWEERTSWRHIPWEKNWLCSLIPAVATQAGTGNKK